MIDFKASQMSDILVKNKYDFCLFFLNYESNVLYIMKLWYKDQIVKLIFVEHYVIFKSAVNHYEKMFFM